MGRSLLARRAPSAAQHRLRLCKRSRRLPKPHEPPPRQRRRPSSSDPSARPLRLRPTSRKSKVRCARLSKHSYKP